MKFLCEKCIHFMMTKIRFSDSSITTKVKCLVSDNIKDLEVGHFKEDYDGVSHDTPNVIECTHFDVR